MRSGQAISHEIITFLAKKAKNAIVLLTFSLCFVGLPFVALAKEGPIVYRLGHKLFKLGSRVRLPVGSDRYEATDSTGVIMSISQALPAQASSFFCSVSSTCS